MKAILLASVLLLAATGCATSVGVDIDGGEDLDGSSKPDSKLDGGINQDALAQCEQTTCSSDETCQSVCPNVPNGIECCDQATSKCYAYASTSCPVPSDAGFD